MSTLIILAVVATLVAVSVVATLRVVARDGYRRAP